MRIGTKYVKALNVNYEDKKDEDTENAVGEKEEQVRVKEAEQALARLWIQEEKFWCQRSSLKWLKCGDRNISFFHVSTIQRRDRDRIDMLKNADENWVQHQNQILNLSEEHYLKVFTSREKVNMDECTKSIPKRGMEDMNNKLTQQEVPCSNNKILVEINQKRNRNTLEELEKNYAQQLHYDLCNGSDLYTLPCSHFSFFDKLFHMFLTNNLFDIYVAPEYASIGMLNERSNVNLVDWLKKMVGNKNAEGVLDPKLPEKPNSKALKRVLIVALRYTDSNAQKRPKLGHIVHMLEAEESPYKEARAFLL
ncbi:hypothetical protein Ahy_A01g003494 [Arachis hypogaea]|uniref:non-specific serine/threonine protein kinase n=1 Tax=Arachis hypogaea TaxID=3818 RepID=A0A445ET10_ARAHY|nr:hypothetical protein Ahy_A01g003494 [Arachis hypogaea]